MTFCRFIAVAVAVQLSVAASAADNLCYKPKGCSMPFVAAQAPDKKPPIPVPDDKGGFKADMELDTEATQIEGTMEGNRGAVGAEWNTGDDRYIKLGVRKARWIAAAREIDVDAGGIPNGSKKAVGRWLPHAKVCALFQVKLGGARDWGNLPGHPEFRWNKSQKMIDIACEHMEPPL
jgi:hypothetical protein